MSAISEPALVFNMATEQRDDEVRVEQNARSFITGLSKDAIFWIAISYTGILFLLAALHIFGKVNLSATKQFLVPASIPWFGAVGAVMISFQGMFDYRKDWDPAFNYWHLARPIVGAALGVMSFLILGVIVSLAGSTPPDSDSAPTVARMNIFHVLAFIVGYREQTFRDLLKRVTDLILRPANAPESD